MGIKMAVPNSLARPGVCTSLTRPVNPFEGQVIYETDTNDTLVWTGSAWLNLHFASFDAKGNLFVGTGVSSGTNLAVGSDDSVLVADSSTPGGISWSSSLSLSSLDVAGTLSASEVTGIISGQMSITVENNSGSPLAKASPVYITGFGGTGNPTVDLAETDLPDNPWVLGLLASQIANGTTGQCVLFGVISDIDTSSFDANAQLYLTAAGTLTDTRPELSTDLVQPIARVLRSHATNGQLVVTTGVPQVSAPNSINIPGSITAVGLVDAGSGMFQGSVSGQTVSASTSVTSPSVDASTSLTVQGVQIDTSGANIDEVLVFNGTKFAPANIDTGGKSFAYFMGA